MSNGMIKGLRLKVHGDRLDPQAIAKAIESAIFGQKREAKPFVKKETFAPSSIGGYHGQCPRYWNIAFTGTENWADSFDAAGVANMGIGTVAHEYIQTALKDTGMLVAEEVEIKLEDPPIRGYMDAMINFEGEELPCEIKTTRQEAFAFRESTGKPMATHLIQLLIYLRATGKRRGFLLYLNRNDQGLLVIPVEMDKANEKILEDVFAWLREVRKTWEDGKLPIRPFRKSRETGLPENKICNACPVRQDCFAGPEGDVLIKRMEVPAL